MTDASPFRTGPAFMKDGLSKAKLNRNIINISDMTVDPQSKNVANAQLTEFDQSEPRSNDAFTSTELALLTVICEISLFQTKHVHEDTVQPYTHASASQDPENIEAALLYTEALETNPGLPDSPLLQKITDRQQFSNYLVCPIRLSYRKMYDTTSLTLYAFLRWLSGEIRPATR